MMGRGGTSAERPPVGHGPVAGGSPLFLLVAPAGTGKTTLVERVLAARPTLYRPITATTRPPRPGEVDGVHYHFLSEERFHQLVAEGGFAETASHFGAWYGCPRSELEGLTERPAITIVDIAGAASLAAAYPYTVPIFIQPRSKEELIARLRARGGDTATEQRIARIDEEWAVGMSYRDRVLNDDLEQAVSDLLAIIDREIERTRS